MPVKKCCETFHYKYAQKLLDLSWKYYQALFSLVEQLKSMQNLPNKHSCENYSQAGNLCNIKVKQEFKLIMLDIKVTYVNIFINEPIKIMALLWRIIHHISFIVFVYLDSGSILPIKILLIFHTPIFTIWSEMTNILTWN